MGEKSEGTDKLVVVMHIANTVILGEGGLQFRGKGIIILICQTQDGHTVIFERHGELVIIGRKVRGKENKVHHSLPLRKLTKYTKFL
jgi:hypothetical protein